MRESKKIEKNLAGLRMRKRGEENREGTHYVLKIPLREWVVYWSE